MKYSVRSGQHRDTTGYILCVRFPTRIVLWY